MHLKVDFPISVRPKHAEVPVTGPRLNDSNDSNDSASPQGLPPQARHKCRCVGLKHSQGALQRVPLSMGRYLVLEHANVLSFLEAVHT